ncbi:CDP-alcohol phosphatidyltransferase family protein [Thioalkalivibrio sp. ALR17-21]|uniref:CDP-alcohol phosphatidyltransferase family protein n=1 Tax=Thioalkalivibrio sp. ALR17-21 TaxID=1269813 RepID=UPI000413AA78|nr:CDP-alcohol phosphatidyltransferase family protein [Thioalkalivibrio sp. ALR17-21]
MSVSAALRKPLRSADLALAGLLAIGVATLTPIGPALLLATAFLWGLLWALLVRGAAHADGLSGIPGPGNRVTLVRAALAAPVGGVALLALIPTVDLPVYWLPAWVVTLALLVLLLDGVDGAVARRSGTESAFGARFDMELDAALILALSVLAWQPGPAGPWVLAIGAMRYLFVLAGRVLPWLRAELPPSRRRQAVCVLQTPALLVALAPAVPTSVAIAAAVLALAMLTVSFATDIVYLYRNRPGSHPQPPEETP